MERLGPPSTSRGRDARPRYGLVTGPAYRSGLLTATTTLSRHERHPAPLALAHGRARPDCAGDGAAIEDPSLRHQVQQIKEGEVLRPVAPPRQRLVQVNCAVGIAAVAGLRDPWRRTLRRRNQRAYMNREKLRRLVDRFYPPIGSLHPMPCHRFDARTRGRSPVR